MNAPASSVRWLAQHFDKKCFVTQRQSERFWCQEKSSPVSVFDFYSKQTLKHYLKKRREHGEEWVLMYSAGLTLLSMSKIVKDKGFFWAEGGEEKIRDGIDMGYHRWTEHDEISMDFSVRRGYMLICMTPAMLGEQFVKMRSRKHYLKERLRRVVPAEPSCFVETLILFAKLRKRYSLWQEKNGLYFEHVFFDKVVNSMPLHMVGVSKNRRPCVYRLTEHPDLTDERTGMCYRKLPRRHLRRKTK